MKLLVIVISIFGIQQIIGGFVRNTRYKRSFLGSDQLDRKGRKCHDFCSMIPELCRNGGTCVTDENTCIGKCICAPGWTGQWCRDPFIIPDFREDLIKENDVTTASDLNDIVESPPSAKVARAMESTSLVDELRDGILKELRGRFFTLRPLFSSTSTPSKRAIVGSSAAANESIDPDDDLAMRKTCEKNCVKGDCIKINAIYKCKLRVNATDKSIPKVCGPGFECDHGVCDLEALKTNSYNCICESNYVGQFCTLKCPYDCGEHGHCDIHVADNTYKCFCQWNYTGLNCSELVPEDPGTPPPDEVIFHWYVVGVSVAMVIVMISAVFVVAYFMWRRRLVFMLKIVHYFQHYEEDDGKEYDAFVSYKSCPRDEQFVLHQLFPKLEGEYNFKLCMHFRDFLPGEAIANNIVSAIESSRRTIMILSPEYVQSEWCRMEYQKAQHEMLKLKHKIIPVVLADLSEVKNIDKNLKSIMNSVTYLEWPGQENTKKAERFWKKLELSLPKKSSQPCSQSDSVPSDSFKEPVPESTMTSSELVPSSATNSPISPGRDTICRSRAESPTPSSELTDNNSPRFQKNKRKDFKHFMDKLVRTKLFSRQDSNSSQADLVDDDTVASRSSCGSVSESTLSESTESICSTPDTGHVFLNEINEDIEANAFIPSVHSDTDLRIVKGHSLDRNTKRYFDRRRRISEKLKPSKRNKECLVSSVCEKDHCEGVQCSNCTKFCENKTHCYERNSQEFLNKGFEDDTKDNIECDYCLYERNRSDNNRIRISAVDGSDQLRIQRLSRDNSSCPYCDHVISRSQPYRGSVKQHKDAQNFEIMIQKRKRNASLPRNYKRSTIQNRDGTLNTRDLRAGTHVKKSENSENSYYIDVCEDV
ncbi:uncharacterized protein LOC123523822 [Mercenaria mercenaria]|uniref:uncharacterized protein LOC123523822 n=1 Tax=Mercenaria mercenaria TaxID=6596 RepID=UPI00234EC998|nr:uncharacterized protein LOC123523822 [Mercenaria mercenaria]